MSDWDEIRRLAADLQRAQLSGSVQRLSERNCIEIVNKLVQAKLIEVIYTADGKEYLVPQQLQREIRDELLVSGGRVGLVGLASTLNVDFSHVEAQAQILTKQERSIHLVLGQLISSSYLDSLCQEVNERLQLDGTISMSVLTKEYDLPSEFLQEEVWARLGKIIEGFRDAHDPRIILTTSYVQRNRAKVRGALSAATVPTPVADVVNRFKIEEHLFFSLADELIKTRRLFGAITGGKKASKATFIPHAYSRAQVRWIDDFVAQNGYVEYAAVARLGISDPTNFLKKRFGKEEMYFFSSSCVTSQLLNAVEISVDEAISAESWIDVTSLLPSILSAEDCRQALQAIRDTMSSKKHFRVYGEGVAMADELVAKIQRTFEELMPDQAKKDVASGKYEKVFSSASGLDLENSNVVVSTDKKEERRKKAATGKGGGGTQGRETKTKSTKKKKGGNKRGGEERDDDTDEEMIASKGKQQQKPPKIEFLSMEALEQKLGDVSAFADCPEEVFAELATELYPALTKRYRELVASMRQSSAVAALHDKRKAHAELQDKVNAAIGMARLFERGAAAAFDGQEKKALDKHLLKTICSDAVNALFVFLSEDEAEGSRGGDVTPEKRLKMLKGMDKNEGEALLAIHKALGGDDAAAFIETFEENVSKAGDLFLKKADKKRDRQTAFAHRHSLLEQLELCEDPALALHLTATILYQTNFNQMLHASGKFVPQILQKVSQALEEEDQQLLFGYQTAVVSWIGAAAEDDKKAALEAELRQKMPALKELASKKKKAVSATEE